MPDATNVNHPLTATCPKCHGSMTYVTAMPHAKSPQMQRTTFLCQPCNRTWSYTLSPDMAELYSFNPASEKRAPLLSSRMRYKLKWRADDDGPITPEVFDTFDQAKTRARQLLQHYLDRVIIDVWNDDETWQIVAPPGVADWVK